jgi:hypothetical protein
MSAGGFLIADESGRNIATDFTAFQDNPSAFGAEHVRAANYNMDALEQADSCAPSDALPSDATISSAAAMEGGKELVPPSTPPTLISTPYLQDWTSDACLTNAHDECPAEIPILRWFNGLKTVSPLNSHVSHVQLLLFADHEPYF